MGHEALGDLRRADFPGTLSAIHQCATKKCLVVQCLLPPYATQFTFTLFISVSQHVSAYAKAIFRCGTISNNIILKKLLLFNGSVNFTVLYSVCYLFFSILKFVIKLLNTEF
jgi:hypothetical protein